MRNVIITICFFFCSLVFGAGQSPQAPNRIPERLEGVKEAVFFLDSAVNALVGWEANSGITTEDLESAERTWAKFKKLCEEDEYEKALDFYYETDEDAQKRHSGDFILFLKHSTNQYVFVSSVLKPLLFEYRDRTFALEELVGILRFQKTLGDLLITANADDDEYVPEVYVLVVRDLGYALAELGRVEEAFDLLEDFVRGIYRLVDSQLRANFLTTIYISSVDMIAGDSDAAIEAWTEFKSYHLAHGDEYDPAELTSWLEQADEEIAEIKSIVAEAEVY